MSSTACIKCIKIGSPSFKPTLIVGLLLASSQVDCTNHCIASLIFLALDLIIGPFGTCKGSLRLGPPWFPSTELLQQVQGLNLKKLNSHHYQSHHCGSWSAHSHDFESERLEAVEGVHSSSEVELD